jgi:hypothetical protein
VSLALRRPAPVPAAPSRLTAIGLAQAGAAGAVAVLSIVRFLVAPLDRYDEGVTLTKAFLTGIGQVPFRDYWITYGPLDPYLLAGAFQLAGTTVVVERLLGALTFLLLALAGYAIAGRLGLAAGMRLLISGLISIGAVAVPAFNSAFLANLIGVAALLVFFISLERGDWRWPLLAGAGVGLASFARPEFALALGTGISGGYLALGLRRSTLVRLLPFVGGGAAVAGSLWGLIVWQAGPGPVWFDIFVHALQIYPRSRSIPLGQGHEGAMVVVLSLAFVLVWTWAAWHLFRRRFDPADRARMIALMLTVLLLFTWVRVRADGAHALGVWPSVAILLALLLAHRRHADRPAPAGLDPAVSIAGMLLFALAAGGLVARDLSLPSDAAPVARAGVSGARAWMPASQLAALIRTIDAQSPPGRPIWVGLQRNDLVTFNDTMLYFLSARTPGTTYYESLPGLTTSDAVQQTIICQLETAGVTLAVLGPNTPGEPWNLSSVAGSGRLDRWLESRAISREQLGPYQLVRLRPVPGSAATCPSSDAFAPAPG